MNCVQTIAIDILTQRTVPPRQKANIRSISITDCPFIPPSHVFAILLHAPILQLWARPKALSNGLIQLVCSSLTIQVPLLVRKCPAEALETWDFRDTQATRAAFSVTATFPWPDGRRCEPDESGVAETAGKVGETVVATTTAATLTQDGGRLERCRAGLGIRWQCCVDTNSESRWEKDEEERKEDLHHGAKRLWIVGSSVEAAEIGWRQGVES